ncbi:peptidyl-prolyl cis-trans isomerase D [Oceanospirillum multiglobuliferum]|uniref:Periplasmic chaperone PpiD n=1 Tax=Oceanospirillum multiglobuliferum TaxID=64969 RepID=A0A1T4R6R4_9GAMM|nr:SurA N-terminal domain-containing protein [Oceanospirillum multiglobuliferum]OPX55210.1 hypothetical protein BTE48_09725 [Oceanospirillum multiglobuliferum]SKA11516.1 peptidyl-prolyl cis-trans isomerase D [Oceanospirillum multiglobuliferum]
MLQNIRDKSSGWVAKIIVGFIVITFAMFGVDAIVGAFTSGGDEVATVNDKKISRYELEVAAQRQVRQILAQMGPDADPASLNENQIRQRALQGLIDREAALQAARNAGLGVSDLQIDRIIISTPEFKGADGKFNADQFNSTLRNVGLTPLQFREELKKDVLINQYQSGLGLSTLTADKYVEQVIKLDSQTRDISYVTLNVDAVTVPPVTEEDVTAYYEQNREAYQLPERVRLNYIALSQDDIAAKIEVSQSDIESAYQAYMKTAQNQTDYFASHILLETDGRTEDEAIAQLQQIRNRVLAGESFSEVAKEVSEDVGSASIGGELGMIEAGSFDQTFETALFALSEGGISEPIVTEFGVHLIRLDRKTAAEITPIAEMRDSLVEQLKASKAAKQYLALTEELANAAFASDDLATPAKELGLSVQETTLFSSNGGEGIAANAKVIRAAFSDELKLNGENSDLIELDSQNSVVIRVAELKEPAIQPLVEVTGNIRLKLEAQARKEQLLALADQLLVQAQADGLSAAAKSAGLELVTVNGISRVEQSVPQAVVKKAFTLETGATTKVLANGDVLLLSLNQISQPETQPEMVAFYQQAIQMNQIRHNIQQVRVSITNQAEINRL